jgi:alkanesulfonate monooxygenase SsuD/methylene tetrahydromethanopterin reductase-like flavin-dependent oxidoreductase (luciferase family)
MKVSYLGMTSYEGPAPGIEVWPAPSAYCDPAIASASIERTLALCEKAEALGFDWVSVSEHHYAPYMMTPNPAVMAAAITQRVKKAKIALLGPLVPLSNPVRLAEELAMLDAMSGGRLVVLFLRGTPNEHNTYDTPPAQTRSMTQEGIDLIVKAWQEDKPFSWKGENYEFRTVSVWPRVMQKPHPLLYGSGNSEESIQFAAKRRMGIAFSFAPPEAIRGWIELYRTASAKEGWEPTPEHVIYRSLTYIAETDQRAEAEAMAFFGAKTAEQAKLQSATMGGPPVNSLILKPYFLGSPKSVLEGFEVLKQCGVGVVDMVFTIGSHDQQVNAMELFAKHVLPTIKEWDQSEFPNMETQPKIAAA